MTYMELAVEILRALSFVALYVFIGFGPGFVIGMLLANATVGRGREMIMEVHIENKKSAAQHNAQWNPSNPRWK